MRSQINDPVAIAENNITVSQNRLIQNSLTLCDIFKYEFIFCKPCQELERIITEVIQNLSHTEIITTEEVLYINIAICSINNHLFQLFGRNVAYKKNYGVEDSRKLSTIVQTKNIIIQTGIEVFNTK